MGYNYLNLCTKSNLVLFFEQVSVDWFFYGRIESLLVIVGYQLCLSINIFPHLSFYWCVVVVHSAGFIVTYLYMYII